MNVKYGLDQIKGINQNCEDKKIKFEILLLHYTIENALLAYLKKICDI